jgi:hypothetical protein
MLNKAGETRPSRPLRSAISRRWRLLFAPPRPCPLTPLSIDLANADEIPINATDLARLRAIAPEPVSVLEVTYLRVQRVLSGADLQYAKLLIGSALVAAHLAPDGPGREDQIRILLAGYAADIGGFLAAREQVSARAKYTRGLFLGVWLSILVLAAIGFLAIGAIRVFFDRAPTTWELFAVRDVLVAVGGGGAGAVVSVLIRLSSATFIDYEAVTAGAARNRIMLGWFFAAAVVFLVKGGIVTVVTDPSAAVIESGGAAAPLAIINSWFFWGAIGFLAGFNERWARSLITRSDDQPSAVPSPKMAVPQQSNRTVANLDESQGLAA